MGSRLVDSGGVGVDPWRDVGVVGGSAPDRESSVSFEAVLRLPVGGGSAADRRRRGLKKKLKTASSETSTFVGKSSPVYAKPLVLRESNLSGRRGTYGGYPSQVSRLPSKVNALKMRGSEINLRRL